MKVPCSGLGHRMLTLLIAAMVTASCRGENLGSRSATVRDSAGIRIVDNHGVEGIRAPFGVSPEPIFHIGWDPGEPEFEDLRFGFIRQDGYAVVADIQADLLHWISPSGEVSATFGGEGEGPGEFRRIMSLLPLGGDSVMVSDRGNVRITVFEGEDFVRDFRFANIFGDASYDPAGRMGEDTFILLPTGFLVSAMEDGEVGWKEYPIIVTKDFADMDTVASLGFMKALGPERWNPVRHYGSVALTGGLLAHAQSDQPQVTWLGGDGAIIQIARWDASGTSVDEDDWVAYERGARLRANPDTDAERFEQRLRDRRRDFGGKKPLFQSAYGDRMGGVWLGEYDISKLTSSNFFLVSQTGEWIGSVSFPRDIRILDITEDRVLGVETNELGVQALVMYRFEPAIRGGD